MDITPSIRIACAGALGYAFGFSAKTNPTHIALTWAIAEAAIQIFKQFVSLNKNNFEYPLRLIVGGLACIYLNEYRLISNVTQAIFSLIVFNIIPKMFPNHKYRVVHDGEWSLI